MALEQPIATSTIVSQAFRLLRIAGVSSFGDDSEQAQDAAEQYPLALRACLEHDADWGFASELAALPEAAPDAGEATDPDLPYSYVLPGDMVAIRRVGNGWVRWRRDRRFLRADAPGPLAVRYTVFIADEAQLPATFQFAVAARLAVLLAPRWLDDRGKRSDLEDAAGLALAAAARQSARQASPERWDGRSDTGDWADEATL